MVKGSGDWLDVRSSRVVSAEVLGGWVPISSISSNSSSWCELYLCQWGLFFQLVQVLPVPMLSTGMGGDCDYRVC